MITATKERAGITDGLDDTAVPAISKGRSRSLGKTAAQCWDNVYAKGGGYGATYVSREG
jgi:hypothetical protein